MPALVLLGYAESGGCTERKQDRTQNKVIATVDDLDRIAADDTADVPALSGWRRELFGNKALALKHGRLSLAIEKGRVVAVERG